MKGDKLFVAIGEADDKYVSSAGARLRSTSARRAASTVFRVLRIAASVVLVLAIIVGIWVTSVLTRDPPVGPAVSGDTQNGDTAQTTESSAYDKYVIPEGMAAYPELSYTDEGTEELSAALKSQHGVDVHPTGMRQVSPAGFYEATGVKLFTHANTSFIYQNGNVVILSGIICSAAAYDCNGDSADDIVLSGIDDSSGLIRFLCYYDKTAMKINFISTTNCTGWRFCTPYTFARSADPGAILLYVSFYDDRTCGSLSYPVYALYSESGAPVLEDLTSEAKKMEIACERYLASSGFTDKTDITAAKAAAKAGIYEGYDVEICVPVYGVKEGQDYYSITKYFAFITEYSASEPGAGFTADEDSEVLGNYRFNYTSGQRLTVICDGRIYKSLTDAYNAGKVIDAELKTAAKCFIPGFTSSAEWVPSESDGKESEGLSFAKNKGSAGYYVSGIGTCTDTNIVIPESYNGEPVTGISPDVFAGKKSLESIVIPGTVEIVQLRAFKDCPNLKRVVMKNGVKHIYSDAFSGCTALESVKLPESLLDIDIRAFKNCSALTEIYLPYGITKILEEAFYGCSSLKSVTVPACVTQINVSTFAECASLESVLLPSGLQYIQNDAFLDCRSLKDLVLPDGLKIIGGGAFEGCRSLESIVVPDRVSEIGGAAFSDCGSLRSVTLGGGVKELEEGLFRGCASLSSIDIPKGVTRIGEFAFQNCSSLTSVSIPSSVTQLGDRAFSGCASLVSLTVDKDNLVYESVNNCVIRKSKRAVVAGCASSVIPDGVKTISESAFYGVRGLKSVVIPNGVKEIGSAAFAECLDLESVVIPDSVTSIYSSAFAYCAKLKSVTIPGSVTFMENHIFSDCISLESAVIGEGITLIRSSIFDNCVKLKEITIPVSVTEMHDAIRQTVNLESVKYAGTIAQWEAIYKANWNIEAGYYTVYCKDGAIIDRADEAKKRIAALEEFCSQPCDTIDYGWAVRYADNDGVNVKYDGYEIDVCVKAVNAKTGQAEYFFQLKEEKTDVPYQDNYGDYIFDYPDSRRLRVLIGGRYFSEFSTAYVTELFGEDDLVAAGLCLSPDYQKIDREIPVE